MLHPIVDDLSAQPRALASLRSDLHGSVLVQALILLVAVTLAAAAGFKALKGGLSAKASCAAEAIASLQGVAGPCGESSPDETPEGQAEAPEGQAEGTTEDQRPDGLEVAEPEPAGPEGPELEDSGPLVALPFPGSVAVSCTAVEGQKEKCKDQPGVRVQATGELSVERSQTRLDSSGCPVQDLSVSAKLQVEASGKAKGKKIGGTLAVFTGTSTKFKVTVSPDAADQIARFERPPPNPIDPTTLLPGESVELSEEFFSGLKLSGTYRALQLEMGFEEGRRLSSGVKRIDEGTVRIFVGDSDFVRHAMAVGASVGEFGISVGGRKELASGELRAIDIDISTQAGFDAYQEFIATGRLPDPGSPGTSRPTTSETLDISESAKIEAKLGRVKIGGVLSDAEGHLTETRNQDGSTELVLSGRKNDVGLTIRRPKTRGRNVPPDRPTPGESTFSLFVEGVDPTRLSNFEKLTGQSLQASDGNVRLDFTESDLRAIQGQAVDQLLQRAREIGMDISREELVRLLREDPNRLRQAGLDAGFDQAFNIAAAKSPDEVLLQLYNMGGLHGNGNKLIDNLTGFALKTAQARNGLGATPKDNADSRLPGKAGLPSCGG